jgi:hypothetical protein
MAGIDYNILNQIKGVQIEPPENAMMRAMQLRGLQEASQMNALKMQEYQQDVMEKNELAKIYANPDLKPGSQEFFNEIYRRAPRAADKLATAEVQRQLALSTQQTREQQRREAEQKLKKEEEDYRSGVRNNRLIQIANAETPEEAYEMLQHYYGQGDLGYADYKSLAPQLIENPNWEKTRTSLLARTLPAEKQLTVPFDIRKAQAGASEEEQKLAAVTLDFETKQLDARRKQFESVYPPNLIRSEKDVRDRILLQAQDPALKRLLTRFGTLEEIIARDVAEFNSDPLGYKKRLAGVSAADILKAAEEKDREAYEDYKTQEVLAGRKYVDLPTFLASRTARPAAAPVEAAAAAPSPDAAAVVPTAAPAPKSVDTSVTVTPSGTSETKAIAPVSVEAGREGFDFMDPTAERLYKYATTIKDATKAASVRAIAKEIQDASVKSLEAKRKEGDFSAEYQDVILARKKVQELKKLPPTPEILEEINDLLDMIKVSKQGKGSKVEVKLPPQEKEFEGRLGKGQAENILDSQKQAKDARDMLDTVRIGRGILKSGAITGAGADFFVGLNQALKTAGVDFGYADASANSQAYSANMAQNVGKLIKLFGAGTGLSNADRDYAERMAGGKIALDRAALEKILDIQDRAARNVIKRHNQSVKGIKTNIPLEVEIEPENVAPAAPKTPAIGAIKDGYKFKGGNPADKNNWEKVK